MNDQIRNRILLMTGTDKYHDLTAMANKVKNFLTQAGYQVTLTNDPEMYHWYIIRDFDVIIDMTIHSFLSEQGEKGLLDSIIGHPWGNTCHPKGFVGIHGATSTYLNSAKYLKMIGAELLTHPEVDEYEFIVEDKDHPIMEGIEDFKLKTELYLVNEYSNFDTLLSCEYLDVTRPAVWCKPYGQGRVVYCSFGHTIEEFKNKQFQKIIINAVKWSTYKGNAEFPYL